MSSFSSVVAHFVPEFTNKLTTLTFDL